MVIRKLPSGPWKEMALAILGPVHGDGQQTFVIVAIDMYSRWPEMYFTNGVVTGKVIEFLETLFSREGLPNSILTDNGVQLVSKEMAFLNKGGIVHKKCSLYHPEAN